MHQRGVSREHSQVPIFSRIDSSLGVVFSKFQDVVTPEDIEAQVEMFKTDTAFQPSFNHLIDTRRATRFDLSSEDMHRVSLHSVFNEKSRRAVAAETAAILGVAQMYKLLRQAYKKTDRVEVFRDMAEARRWLGLD